MLPVNAEQPVLTIISEFNKAITEQSSQTLNTDNTLEKIASTAASINNVIEDNHTAMIASLGVAAFVAFAFWIKPTKIENINNDSISFKNESE